jgi:CRISPR-associated exonuclease Cas4
MVADRSDREHALFLLLIVALVVYALLSRWSRSERAHVGLSTGTIATTDDAAERAPTLRSRRYGLVGRPDQLVRVGRALIPVEQKPKARRLQQSHILQVAAQCLLVQEVYGIRPPYGIVVLAGGYRHKVEFSPSLELRLLDTMTRMRAMLSATAPPEPLWVEGKCRACSFRQTCWGEGTV